MWVVTTRGFYSAVAHRDDPAVIILRARAEEDLLNLGDLIKAKPWFDATADYPWRMECSAADWSKACALMALEIDYPNFKKAVAAEQGQARANVYMNVWSAMWGIERIRKVGRRRKRRSGGRRVADRR